MYNITCNSRLGRQLTVLYFHRGNSVLVAGSKVLVAGTAVLVLSNSLIGPALSTYKSPNRMISFAKYRL